jgi:bacteriocin biosynthesis cyclodehydratase domain-containing protein
MGARERPLLKPWYRLAWANGACLLEYGGAAVSIEGAAASQLLPALLPLLDGNRTVAEIEATLGAAIAPAIRQALAGLEQAGVLTDGPPLRDRSANGSETAIAELLSQSSPAGDSPSDVAESLRRSTVAICGSGESADALAGILEACGLASVDRVGLADLHPDARANELLVVAPAPPELAVLVEVNELALERALPWLQVVPFDGHAACAGPLFLPGATCCQTCFRLRRASTSGYRAELAALERIPASYGVARPVAGIVAGLAAIVALRWLNGRDACLPGRVWTVELWPTPSVSEHVAYRVPRCPTCSQADAAARPSPWFEPPVAVT